MNVIECEKKEKKATGSRTWVNSFDLCQGEGRGCADANARGLNARCSSRTNLTH